MDDVVAVTEDLRAEHDALDSVVAELSAGEWAMPTPSPGWSVADQIGHLGYFDDTARIAIHEPEQFSRLRDELFAAAFGAEGEMDQLTLGWARSLGPAGLLGEWRLRRSALVSAAGDLDAATRVEWYGPSMGARSFLTARLMETWAHGQDVVDAVGAERPATDRLVNVAQLGVITRSWSYANRGGEAPDAPIRVELVAPSGTHHVWGEESADDSVVGEMEAFCLVVTQRRHVDETELVVTGDAAAEWMRIAQAFAGAPSDGRPAPS